MEIGCRTRHQSGGWGGMTCVTLAREAVALGYSQRLDAEAAPRGLDGFPHCRPVVRSGRHNRHPAFFRGAGRRCGRGGDAGGTGGYRWACSPGGTFTLGIGTVRPCMAVISGDVQPCPTGAG